MTPQLVVATRSVGKIRELNALLRQLGFDVLSLDDVGIAIDAREDALEIFDTFEENALAKARWFYARSNGIPVLADDSGLQVNALGGLPGVRSKRWSHRSDLEGQALDDANNQFLWEAIDAGAKHAPLTARYVCAAACVSAAGESVSLGATDGELVRAARGGNGFGYDPHFYSTELRRTFAEASLEEKALVSHRGRAFRKLVHQLKNDPAFMRSLSR